ncbi:MAG: nucleoside hydrolase-like domain-containing protein [Adhaeribacter sp.]
MNKTTFTLLLALLVTILPGLAFANSTGPRPRTIVMTDGEIDDHSSMIRFLLYTCDVDLQAIIETNSLFQRHGHSREDWLEKQIAAYERVYPNLIKHNPNYPTAEEIRRKSFVGDEDPNHLNGLLYIEEKPGHKIVYMPDNWPNTPGSDRIVEVLLDPNPSPVYIQAWGGGNTAAKAFYKLKKEYPAEYDRAISKVVMYNIWYQDDAGNYIERHHPKVKMVYNSSFFGSWDYNSLPHTALFIAQHVKNNHGPLGALYPQLYVSEGDTPAFLYLVNNGLRNHENPVFGGWGGRFTKAPNLANVYVDAHEEGDEKRSLKRWINQANADFQARMDWCVASSFKGANHTPNIKVNVSDNLTVRGGQTINLNADGTTDPDGNSLSYRWWQYQEAGTYPNAVTIQRHNQKSASLVAPTVTSPQTVHIILEVTDNGSPALVSYKRIVVTLTPGSAPTPAPEPTPAPAPPAANCAATGTILREQWNNIYGTAIVSIPLNNAPSSTSYLNLFEGPTNVADNYGSRIRGYICPPQTGNYTFFIAGDDHSELWLSTDENPVNKRKIAGVNGWTDPREWNKYSSQRSVAIRLESGKRYYIEALQKDGAGGDNLAVGWQLPNGAQERPIAGSRLSPFVAASTPPPAPTPPPPASTPAPAPVNCTATGTILREQWNNVGGNAVSSIPVNKTPNSTSYLTLFEGPTDIQDYYGSRIRGYVCPPQTGNYIFFISGDDNAELWLSTNEKPENKRRIADINGWTAPREWNKYSSQKSIAIRLEAGKRYYIEALHKEAYAEDNLAVGWQLPDGALERPIGGNRLAPFVPANPNVALSGKSPETTWQEQVAEAGETFDAYPNPFGKAVNLSFTLPTAQTAVVEIYTLQGVLLETIYKAEVKAGGLNEVQWDGSNYANGVYLAKLTYGNQVMHKRLLLQR